MTRPADFTTDNLCSGRWPVNDPFQFQAMRGVLMSEHDMHIPVRPTWRCGACAYEWPCPTRINELKAEPIRGSVEAYLGANYAHAVRDLGQDEREGLWVRFIGWLYL